MFMPNQAISFKHTPHDEALVLYARPPPDSDIMLKYWRHYIVYRRLYIVLYVHPSAECGLFTKLPVLN